MLFVRRMKYSLENYWKDYWEVLRIKDRIIVKRLNEHNGMWKKKKKKKNITANLIPSSSIKSDNEKKFLKRWQLTRFT